MTVTKPTTNIELHEVVEYCVERGWASTAYVYARLLFRDALLNSEHGAFHNAQLVLRMLEIVEC